MTFIDFELGGLYENIKSITVFFSTIFFVPVDSKPDAHYLHSVLTIDDARF